MINGITTNASVYSFPNVSPMPGSGKSLLTHEQIKQLVQKEIPELSAEKLADDMEISKPIDLIDRTVHLSVNKNINRVIITVVDKESNEVVSEFPCEEIQHLAAHLKEAIGLLYDDEA